MLATIHNGGVMINRALKWFATKMLLMELIEVDEPHLAVTASTVSFSIIIKPSPLREYYDKMNRLCRRIN